MDALTEEKIEAIAISGHDQEQEFFKDLLRDMPRPKFIMFLAMLRGSMDELEARRQRGDTSLDTAYMMWVSMHAKYALTEIALKVREDEKAKENDNPDPSH